MDGGAFIYDYSPEGIELETAPLLSSYTCQFAFPSKFCAFYCFSDNV